jgi:hypothetical protein
MKIYRYENYNEYVKCQKQANERKKNNVWVVEENIKFLSEYLKPLLPIFGLCHGVRQGHEVDWFSKYLPDCNIFGTEIGEVRKQNIVQWDFNYYNPAWAGKFDFIYSNSFDHAYDPIVTLNVWAGQLKSGGLIFLEYDKRQEHTGEISKSVNKTDPVSITVDELVNKIPEWINTRTAEVLVVLDMPIIKKEFQKTVVIQIN